MDELVQPGFGVGAQRVLESTRGVGKCIRAFLVPLHFMQALSDMEEQGPGLFRGCLGF